MIPALHLKEVLGNVCFMYTSQENRASFVPTDPAESAAAARSADRPELGLQENYKYIEKSNIILKII